MAAQPSFLERARALARPTSVQSLNHDMHKVVVALRAVPGHTALTAEELLDASGVDLSDYAQLVERLRVNPKVVVHDGDLMFAYNPVHKISNRKELLELVNSTPEGLPDGDIADSYATVRDDIDALVESARVVAVVSTDSRGMVLFPRPGRMLCRLSGHVNVTNGSATVTTTADLRSEIDRGDAIVINGITCRVSSNTTDKRPGEQVESWNALSKNTGAGLTAASTQPHKMTAGKRYRHDYTETALPLQSPYSGETATNVPAFKYGYTNDVRALWYGMEDDASWPRDAAAMRDHMMRAGIGTAEGKKRFKARAKRRAKPKRRRKQATGLSAQMSYLAGTAAGNAVMEMVQEQG